MKGASTEVAILNFFTRSWSLGDDGATYHHRLLQTALARVLKDLERNHIEIKSSKYNFQDERFKYICIRLVTGRLYSNLKIAQKIWAVKIIVCKNTKKMVGPKRKYLCNGQNLFRTVEKTWKIKPFCHSRAWKNKKNNATFCSFSPSWGIWRDPYI